MIRSSAAIAVILAASCAATEPAHVYPRALSQYGPLNVSNVSMFGENILEGAVHRELLQLTFFGVFDNLTFSVDGGTVVLGGQVFHPELRDDAEIAVAGIPGVSQIVNHITFLPDSPADNRVRVAVFRAIYSHPSLSIYSTVGSGGAIHLVVQGGRVTLEGEVGSTVDARRAADLARVQPGVISVTNHLTTGR